jgi:membrane protein
MPLFFTKAGRTFISTINGFIDDDCYEKASALTYYSLLAIIPLLAVIFGLAQGFGFEDAIILEINQSFPEQPQLTEKLIEFAQSWLKNIKGGVIVGVGTAILFWTVLGLLSSIETALNTIWKVKNSRHYLQRISNYIAALIIAPLFIVISSSITIFITTQINVTAQNNSLIEAISPFLLASLKLLPYLLSSILFTLIYLFMPNVSVKIKPALFAGVLAGVTFQFWQWFYIKFQIGISSYGAIYGSFAALPLFLIWLQISWLILLAGAEFAVHIEYYLFIPNSKSQSVSEKTLAILMAYRCADAFLKGLPPVSKQKLSLEFGLPLDQTQKLLDALKNAGILSEITLLNNELTYQPAKGLDLISMQSIGDAIDASHNKNAFIPDSPDILEIFNHTNNPKTNISSFCGEK